MSGGRRDWREAGVGGRSREWSGGGETRLAGGAGQIRETGLLSPPLWLCTSIVVVGNTIFYCLFTLAYYI